MKGEISRSADFFSTMASNFQGFFSRIEVKNTNAVMAPIGSVNGFAIGVDHDFSSGVITFEILGECGSGCESFKIVCFGGPAESCYGGVGFVNDEKVLASGMKS
jgi:hypothetical protein